MRSSPPRSTRSDAQQHRCPSVGLSPSSSSLALFRVTTVDQTLAPSLNSDWTALPLSQPRLAALLRALQPLHCCVCALLFAESQSMRLFFLSQLFLRAAHLSVRLLCFSLQAFFAVCSLSCPTIPRLLPPVSVE
jgi:hypothetical protein